MAFLNKTGLARLWANIIALTNTKVDKVEGKKLSTNDFTNEYKEKLDNLENIDFNETDPTVPAWAKEPTKPSYTADEVGALSKDTELFSGDYNDLENAPNITEDDSGNLVIADNDGNIIFRSDANGFETTQLTTDVLVVNGKDIDETIGNKQNKITGTAGQFVVIGDDGNITTKTITDFVTMEDVKAYIEETILGGAW